ncbi:Bug family tripartite tricarboxylate transporter substrate binding protein [Comamonas endophytica]|uniref:Tripartite tricarboxylate transporter substrate binding protein n=1 Tax=Comamonas endophytica TaxID=2949090 RepID=A0ABY6G8H5_9BURK|nr:MULTISPECIES: tripartite tricarboxylate transporter substrate binding protein [unclassified Acidovorax]MCD2514071.1 tripartite tricarboxylate transporter substrate binding protein [Acidovorax sp. D4N7]UYG51213.1 tripartite tricarboxylate transporter substrate binding protein [Acidovorax sp. 5MLIR]
MNKPSTFSFRRRTLGAGIAAALALAAPGVFAQGAAKYPAKPLTFVVPFAAGSATDQIARALGQFITQETGQAVVVENKGGASGMLAAQGVARAAPDGYTVLITTNTTHAANEHLYKKLPYDPVKDFAPVTGLGKGGQVLVVNAASPHKSVADLVAYAKANPGKLSFGSGSSSSRMAGEMLKQLAGVDILHVPYKSNPLAITDLLGGQIDLMITDVSTGLPQVQAGKLKALGFSTQERSSMLPDVPTIEQAGVKGYNMGYWFAAYLPAGTPPQIVNQLSTLLGKAVESKQAASFYTLSGTSRWHGSPEELARFQAEETAKWGKVIKAAGIQPE